MLPDRPDAAPSLQWPLTPSSEPRSLNYDTPPGLEVAAGSQGKIVLLSGQWTALALARDRERSGAVLKLRALATDVDTSIRSRGEWAARYAQRAG